MNSKKLLVKNSIALYSRMILTILIGLYSSRVVLELLGVDDYGVYNIVGGVVGLTSFFNASMSSASSRFITYELGTKNSTRLVKTFSASVTVHLGIAIVTLLLCETLGLWLVNYKLVLPEDTLSAANYVYQFSILTTCITIIQVPFTAAIMAHEKMGMFAYLEILNSLLKLIIVWLLIYLNSNKLILYSFLLLSTSIVIFCCYYYYCKRNFKECTLKLNIDKTYIKPLLSYSGWDLFGNLSVTAKQQGSSIVLNLFYGVVANASAGIANIINGTVLGFSQVSMTAFRPQIIKNYAAGQIPACIDLINLALKISILFYATLVVPIFICMDDILRIWLTVTPEYSSIFCRIMLLSGLFNMLSVVFITGMHATGNIKAMNVIGCICNLLTLVTGYVGYKLGASTTWIYWCFCFFNIIISISVLVLLKHNIAQLSYTSVIVSIGKIILCSAIIVTFAYIGTLVFQNQYLKVLFTCLFSGASSCFSGYYILLTSQQRINLRQFIVQKFINFM